MSLQAVLRFLLPKEDHFYDILERHAALVETAARALTPLKDGNKPSALVRDQIQEFEHQADKAGADMIEALGRTFVTPLDREDLQKLSKRLDDIVDLTNATARACVLFGVERPTKPMALLIDKLIECASVINATVPKLRKHSYPEVIKACSQIHFFEKAGDTVFRDALSNLFHDPNVDAKTILREKEILEDLEKAINRCDQASELLTNIAVKNS